VSAHVPGRMFRVGCGGVVLRNGVPLGDGCSNVSRGRHNVRTLVRRGCPPKMESRSAMVIRERRGPAPGPEQQRPGAKRRGRRPGPAPRPAGRRPRSTRPTAAPAAPAARPRRRRAPDRCRAPPGPVRRRTTGPEPSASAEGPGTPSASASASASRSASGDRAPACVEIKILRRVHACSMAWPCRFLTARRSQRGHAIAEK
jgi:hypothetical protein